MDINNYEQDEKKHLFYKIIHFSMEFSAVLNIFYCENIAKFYFYKWFKKKIKDFEKCL